MLVKRKYCEMYQFVDDTNMTDKDIPQNVDFRVNRMQF